MTGDDRYIQFYIEDVGTTVSRRARDGMEIPRQFGGVLGVFPSGGGEEVSWYLCDCEEEAVARRVRGPDDLGCPLCESRPRCVQLCRCGVASSVESQPGDASCPWCHRTAAAEAHDCRAIDGMEVIVDRRCPFCDRAVAMLIAGGADARAEAADRQEGAPESEALDESDSFESSEPEVRAGASPTKVEPADRETNAPGVLRGVALPPTRAGGESLPSQAAATETGADEPSPVRSGFVIVVTVVAVAVLGISLFQMAPPEDGSAPGSESGGETGTSAAPVGTGGGGRPPGESSPRDMGAQSGPDRVENVRAESGPDSPPQERPSTQGGVADKGKDAPGGAVQPDEGGETEGPEEGSGPEPEADAAPREVRLASAQEALERGDWEGAVAGAEAVLAGNPEDSVAQALLERALDRREEIEHENQLELWRVALKNTESIDLREYYARRILSEDPDDPLAVAVRARARNEAVERSKREAETGNVEAVTAIWDEYQRAWPDDELADVERQHWTEEATGAAPFGRGPAPERVTNRSPSGPSPEEVKHRTLDQLRPVEIPTPWSFEMGCTRGDPDCSGLEKPRHDVEITRPFRITAYETTNDAYRNCVEHGPCPPPRSLRGREDREEPVPFEDPNRGSHPVVHVSWEHAQTFCGWLGGRLPTEAEWEAAARGLLRGSRYPWIGEPSHDKANFAGTGGRDRWEATSPVGSFEANRYGLFDMAGNVREWVNDWRGTYRKSRRGPAKDPRGPASSQGKIIRGGSWKQPAENLRVSYREWAGAIGISDDLGFRCVIKGS